jgi:hypothetical protein
MQPIITQELLVAAGIQIDDEHLDAYLDDVNDLLTERIGEAITDSLDDEKFDELTVFQETASQEQLSAWVEKNVPELQDIIKDEIDILIGDLVEQGGDLDKLSTEEPA